MSNSQFYDSSSFEISKPLELWGGVECTVNRVGNEFFNQLERSGHADRLDDLDRFAELGISALRYPVLWELTAPDGIEQANWGWTDQRLQRLRELEIKPIVGLVHHGSGPRHTNLLDPTFPQKLAEYAGAVACRYPWIANYTPVNEPLTTARFSGLYGHWYPHAQDGLSFARALLTECKAVVLAMRAIREVNSKARLVQTDDLGKTFSTSLLAYQAEFENERRWITFDLLSGRLDRYHPLWGYLRWVGIGEAELEWFNANPCPPDVIGLNYYLTSERFLDERLELYPAITYGGNGRHSYADVEAVRVRAAGIAGPRQLLREAWERYRLPLAITEAHLGCTREEQLRWLWKVWEDTRSVRQQHIAVEAVTAWSLLGAFDWHCLVTRNEGQYEPGVFDLRGPTPRPTALAKLMTNLAAGQVPDHPLYEGQGWWQRPERLIYGFSVVESGETQPNPPATSSLNFSSPKVPPARPLLITGATGTLGRAFARLCEVRGLPYRLLNRQQLDIANPASVAAALDQWQPWAVINTAGYVRVDQAERDAEACFRENSLGPSELARACARRKIRLATFSSDLVFDGSKNAPYLESDPVAPLNVYGRSKVAAERQVLEILPSSLLIRTSAFFGPWDEYNFVTLALKALAGRESFRAAEDGLISPTYVPDLVNTCLDLLIDGEQGLWHLANQGALSWAELAQKAAELAGINSGSLQKCFTNELDLAAKRPPYSVLGSARGLLLPPLENALVRYLEECDWSNQHHENKAAA